MQQPIRAKHPDSERVRLVDGARRSFLAHGFRGVTMDDLAHSLGVSKKTFYRHFPSKTALLQAVMDSKFAEVERDLNEVLAKPAASVQQTLGALVRCVQDHTQELGPPLVRDMRRASPEFFEQVSRRRAELIGRAFTKVLSDGRRAGLIRRDIPVPILIDTLLAGVAATVNPTRLAEADLTPRQGFSAVMDLFLEGALVRKGRSK